MLVENDVNQKAYSPIHINISWKIPLTNQINIFMSWSKARLLTNQKTACFVFQFHFGNDVKKIPSLIYFHYFIKNSPWPPSSVLTHSLAWVGRSVNQSECCLHVLPILFSLHKMSHDHWNTTTYHAIGTYHAIRFSPAQNVL